MSTATVPVPSASRAGAISIVTAGLTVGVLDGIAAVVNAAVQAGTPPTRVFQGIASRALLGPAAFDGGAATAALGLAVHFGVALGWATVYGLAYGHLGWLRRLTRTRGGVLLAGAAYGTLVWCVMRLAVLRLLGAPPADVLSAGFLTMVGIHLVCVGTPIASIIRRHDVR